MNIKKSSLFIGLALVVGLTLLRFKPWSISYTRERSGKEAHLVKIDETSTLTVGFLPVTCHLTCPVTDYASKTTQSRTHFQSKRFSDFPTVASAFEAKQIQATFMTVPLAMKLREQGVPIKICYLGHRDGSELVVARSSKARSLRDLKGKTIAIPSLYSNQNLVLHQLMVDQGIQPGEINFVALPPPDMPTSLAAGAIDAFFVGEPFCAKAELEGIGRVLYYARDIWPNFISCALVVHEDLIKEQPQVVKDLVRGIAQSGLWIENHRTKAAQLAAPYFRQDTKLINFVLTSNPHRVSYSRLTPTDDDLERIEKMARKMGFFQRTITMADLIDRQFVPSTISEAKIDLVKIP